MTVNISSQCNIPSLVVWVSWSNCFFSGHFFVGAAVVSSCVFLSLFHLPPLLSSPLHHLSLSLPFLSPSSFPSMSLTTTCVILNLTRETGATMWNILPSFLTPRHWNSPDDINDSFFSKNNYDIPTFHTTQTALQTTTLVILTLMWKVIEKFLGPISLLVCIKLYDR